MPDIQLRFRDIPTELSTPPPGSIIPGDSVGEGPVFQISFVNLRAWIAATIALNTDRVSGLDATLASLQGQVDAALNDALGRVEVANNSGNTTLTPSLGITYYKAGVAVGGTLADPVRVLILATTNRDAGDRMRVVVSLPAVDGVTIQVRDATAGGTLLATFFTSSAQVMEAIIDAEYNGTAWKREYAAQNTLPS